VSSLEDYLVQSHAEGGWGRGSDVGSRPEHTLRYRRVLQRFLACHEPKRVLDLGCGDWQIGKLIDWSGIDYTGIDVLDAVIARNQARHSQPNLHFLAGDFRHMDLPPADLVILKDVLQHWTREEIEPFLPRLQGYPFALITNDVDWPPVRTAYPYHDRWHPLDVTRRPYHWPGERLLLDFIRPCDPYKATDVFARGGTYLPPPGPYELLVIVPYRDRRQHLERFAPHMERFLAGMSWKLVVIEQTAGSPFNRGKLINVGYAEYGACSGYLVMHDVDMLPQDESADYTPADRPVHLAGRASQFHGWPPAPQYVGGVLMLAGEQYRQVNGFSNEFWGYGREDDEFGLRLRRAGLGWIRRPGRYLSLPHARGGIAPLCLRRYRHSQHSPDYWQQDGLNFLRYNVLARRSLRDYLGMPYLAPQHQILTVDLQYESQERSA
jgi:SAM-dependent methyltransferase